ncbi:helix-turn-helix transcriptional regulator [Sporofaciens sp. JLR.KK001]|uniref:helix-turn-helix domain-containing protein n=1 Tax=Sporofaciens sp. JLR.KK001 TaxID=3112621 RepID=UPI002FF0E2FA
MANVAQKIKELRIQNNMTQKKLADLLNVSQNAVYNWENGKREPNSDIIEKLSDIFEVLPSYLMGWRDEDLEIETEIDKLIDRFSNITEHREVSDIVKEMQDLISKQSVIEDKINTVDFHSPRPKKSSIYFDSSEFSESELTEIKNFADFLKSKRNDIE